ncbi:FAD-dependent oxidoreductase [Streptomyces violascens]|uniref:FAD-dependent oxidoreductase n=1 Tax=Streptomyces violascens TaxID=67381 RepID=UPI0037ABD795
MTALDADLVIVGAGPAGVAAALMADSLGMRTVVVESGKVGGKPHHIGALVNVPGDWQTGPDLAQALATDISRLTTSGRCRLLTGRAVRVAGHDDRAEVALADGHVLTAAAVVVASGVEALEPHHTDWITAPDGFRAPPLWRARPEDLHGPVHVLGGDRPLGTWLRAHPKVRRTLTVLCPPHDAYKTAEVADDERVHLVPVTHVDLTPAVSGTGWEIRAAHQDADAIPFVSGTVLNNLGSRPAALEGLVQAEDGYCPPDRQHPRIVTTGDLRSARFQRIVTAQGSGAEASLARYYDTTLIRS